MTECSGEGHIVYAELLERVERTLKTLAAMGIEVKPNSRLLQQRQVLRALVAEQTEHLRTDMRGVQRVFESLHDLSELCDIVRCQKPGTPTKHLKLKLTELVSGSEVATDDRSASAHKARNTQFELVLQSWLRAGGLPCRVAEPDLMVTLGHYEIGIAAKRVRSPKRLLERIAEAGQQIEATRRFGIIALEVSPSTGLAMPLECSQASPVQQRPHEIIADLQAETLERAAAIVNTRTVLGVWVFMRVFGLTQTEGLAFHRTSYAHAFRKPHPDCPSLFNALWLFLRHGLGNVPRMRTTPLRSMDQPLRANSVRA